MKFAFVKLRNHLITGLFVLGLIFALLSIPESGALSGGKLERSASAWVADDENAALSIDGLGAATYDLDNKYSNIGIITNKTNHEVNLFITVKADFQSIQSRNCTLGFKIGNQSSVILNNGVNSTDLMVVIPPFQAVNVQAFLDRNQNHTVTAAFSFTAEDIDRSFNMQLSDAPDSPRRISCY